jgi:transposase
VKPWQRSWVRKPPVCRPHATSLYFEGCGGETIGKRGHNADHRFNLKQMIAGMAVDVEVTPFAVRCGRATLPTTLTPIVKRMRERFRIREISVVADRGMVSQATLEAFENSDPPLRYIVGMRMRRQKEVSISVLGTWMRRVSRPQSLTIIWPSRVN